MSALWEAGTAPWIRRQPRDARARCYFCGEDSAVRSVTDAPDDQGRVEVYCDNTNCDARKMTVLVLQDGTRATIERADVRALALIDEDPTQRGNKQDLNWDQIVDHGQDAAAALATITRAGRAALRQTRGALHLDID